ncbi:hypothetical protein PMM47T1_04874 [Pseudomonas sp. M47T1]|uniref:DUF1120 domain-containing protein n=1 Tax=Pseudomonas sp. M47T1 TaxID=1179778 RepID=UPI0002608287|nr:DUF1120 domain-containing protein [Pseudomonas sp. M47T1]EIK97817.1 hypothetical protein PMM47T1_04874 [Pseudomonas sp. M47T1]
MKLFKRSFYVVVLSTFAASAMAASSVDLAVTGSIIPASCTPTLSMGDAVFSRISAADLNAGKHTLIGERKQQTLSINCQAPTLFGIRGIDNRPGTNGNAWYMTPYGLGLTAQGEKIGAHFMELRMARSTIDSKPAFVTVGDASGTTWQASTTGDKGIRNYGELLGLTDTAGVTSGPIPVKDAVLGMEHYLVINDADTLTLNEEIMLDGSASIEVVYL